MNCRVVIKKIIQKSLKTVQRRSPAIGQVTLNSVHPRAIVFHIDREARQAPPRLFHSGIGKYSPISVESVCSWG
jgi:hypothetical protein